MFAPSGKSPRTVARGFAFALTMLATLLVATSARATDINLMLSGQQEVPPVETSAKGIGVLHVHADRTLTGGITTSLPFVTAAHIHAGARGSNGKVVITLIQAGERWNVPKDTLLTEEQFATLLAGNMYVNVHTPANKEGEIRAQITP